MDKAGTAPLESFRLPSTNYKNQTMLLESVLPAPHLPMFQDSDHRFNCDFYQKHLSKVLAHSDDDEEDQKLQLKLAHGYTRKGSEPRQG